MADQRYATWENFRRHYLDPRVPAEMVVVGTPEVRIEVGDHCHSLTLLVESDRAAAPPSPLANVEIAQAVRSGTGWLAVSIRDGALYRQFYDLCGEIADRVQLDGETAGDAIAMALAAWRALLAPKTVLGIEQQVGLIGELWMLDRIAQARGFQNALDAWTGPAGDPQDFRFDSNEFEIKTTVRAERVHRFSGSRQLVPSEGHCLHVLSLQLAPSAASDDGFSLPVLVQRVRAKLTGNASLEERLRLALGQVGYRDADAPAYAAEWVWRSKAVMIPVDADFPALSNDQVRTLLVPAHRSRLRGFTFDLALDGLGHEDGSAPFLALLPEDQGQ